MLLGCPVTASNTSALPEVLCDACTYFDPNDTIAIGKEITRLIHNEVALAAMKKKGLAQAAKYNWQNSALQLAALLEQEIA